MKSFYTALFLFLFGLLPLEAQEVRPLARQPRSSFEGRHFLVGFMDNFNEGTHFLQALQIQIATSYKTVVRVSLPGVPYTSEYSLKADTVLVLTIPPSFETTESEIIQNTKLVEITSDAPVSVYSFNSKTATSDAYNVIPTFSWGTEYVALTLPNYRNGFDALHRSEFMIMAAEDATTVTIHPRVPTQKGKSAGVPFSVILQKGESYLVKSGNSWSGAGDLSGSVVTADKPIGFLSGHMRTPIPQTSIYKNHLVEMLPPVSTWGKKFITAPYHINGRIIEGDLFRVLNSVPDTHINFTQIFSSDSLLHLSGANSVSDQYGVRRPALWEADQPIALAQFIYSQEVPPENEDDYDPAMAIIPPVEQFVSRVVFQVPQSPLGYTEQFSSHYANVICDSLALHTVRLDGKLLTELVPNIQFQAVGNNPPYYWAAVRVQVGVHVLSTTQGKFSGLLYGTGDADAYAMTMGFSLLDPGQKSDSLPPYITRYDSCNGGVFVQAIDTDAPDKSYLDYIAVTEAETENYTWTIRYPGPTKGEITARPIDPFKNGRITIEARDRAGNGSQYLYEYKAPVHEIPEEISFKTLDAAEQKTITEKIINPSATEILTIRSVKLSGDPRIGFKTLPPSPIEIGPGGAYDLTLVFTPGEGPVQVSAEVILDFGCSRFKKIPVSGAVTNISLLAVGHDFGAVRVGDTANHSVYIVNTSAGVTSAIRLDSLVCVSCTDNFAIDTAGFFPREIFPGDTLFLPARFTPARRGILKDTMRVANTPLEEGRLPVAAFLEVAGRGIAPLIVADDIDFKKRRVGTQTDSMIILRNNGDATATLAFKSMSVDCKNVLKADTTGIFPVTILPGSTVLLPVGFIPDAVRSFKDSILCSVDWRLHEPVVMRYYGEGTLPAISTDSIVFKTIGAGETSDTTAAVIFSTGNEDAAISDIFPVSGDLSAFAFDASWLLKRTLTMATADSVAVQFRPAIPGVYSAVYGVTLEDYPQDTAYIEFRGAAIISVKDTALLKAHAQVDRIIPCRVNSFEMELRNTGNIPVVVDSFALSSVNARIKSDFTFLKPVLTGGSVVIPVELYSELQDSAEFIVYIRLRDTVGRSSPVVLRDTVRIAVEPHFISLDTEPKFEGTPGERITVAIKGSVNAGADADFAFKSRITLDGTLMLIGQKTGTITVTDAFKERQFPVSITQDRNIVEITSDSPFRFDTLSRWEVHIPFDIMLGQEFEANFDVTVSGNECYYGDTSQSKFYIVGVCSPFMRRVTLGERFALLKTYPNPASENTLIEVKMPENGTLEITATDLMGNLFLLERNLYLTKGVHSRKLDITKLSSGMYTLHVRFKEDIQNSLIIITK